jgi:hypothetical protein
MAAPARGLDGIEALRARGVGPVAGDGCPVHVSRRGEARDLAKRDGQPVEILGLHRRGGVRLHPCVQRARRQGLVATTHGARVRACACACVRAYAYACVRAYAYAYACACACARACACACARVRGCAYACARARSRGRRRPRRASGCEIGRRGLLVLRARAPHPAAGQRRSQHQGPSQLRQPRRGHHFPPR